MQQPPILPPTPPPPPINLVLTPPIVYAGSDSLLLFPVSSITLKGSAQYPQHIDSILWKKISGPASFVIENPTSFETNVHSLESGTYEFELSAFGKAGLTGKDTVSVFVNEIIFKNLSWIHPWYAVIEVKNIHLYPIPLKVFIQRDFDNTWIEVKYISNTPQDKLYEYFIETRQPNGAGMYTNGSLYINYYGSNVTDTPNIKILF